ncbi:hypothetical protein N0V88_004710 [Collariella sp. IMI 366227]|nr:hypothetical protein N0V88_004710 [Collariella sp. IMI 366227]
MDRGLDRSLDEILADRKQVLAAAAVVVKIDPTIPEMALESDTRGAKLRVDNIHYELTQEDLEGLFSRIGPLVKLDMKYDRAGRSEGTAFVTYESARDAAQAIREFDGANAAGQPIRISLLPSQPSGSGSGRRNPFDSAVVPGRPLAERITVPEGRGGRDRSLSPRRGEDEEAARRGVDRQKKTQEELDAEMEDYFAGGGAGAEQQHQEGGAGSAGVTQQHVEDEDMIL